MNGHPGRPYRLKAFAGCARLVGVGCVFAAATSLASQGQVSSPPLADAGASALRVVGALVFVLAVFFAGLWVTRNWQRLGLQRGRPARLRVIESRPLGNRQALHLVRYRKQVMLVGASPAGVVLLSDLGEEEQEDEPAMPAAINFPQILSQALNRK